MDSCCMHPRVMKAVMANCNKSIDLTQLPAHYNRGAEAGDATGRPAVEYSSREVSPPALLVQQLVRAHDIFLLHHGTNLSAMLEKHNRTKFCNILEKYWSRFASNWDVLLHGSPAVDIYNGTKLAAGGELGMGVGEEEWGSGERLVLEDFVQKTEGLVDFMVSRFGEPSPLQHAQKPKGSRELDVSTDPEPWLGSGRTPTAADGLVFSGVGALTRRSLRDMSSWIETIYTHGDHAYGVRDNPTADRRKRRRRDLPSVSSPAPSARRAVPENRRGPESVPTSAPNIPPDLIKSVETSLNKASQAAESAQDSAVDKPEPLLASLGDTETWMKYLTLGYSKGWGSKKPPAAEEPPPQKVATEDVVPEAPMRHIDPEPDIDHAAETLKTQIQQENAGYFIIGLKGDMTDGAVDDHGEDGGWNNRTLLRTVHVELADDDVPRTPGEGDSDTPENGRDFNLTNDPTSKLRRLRPVIYVVRRVSCYC